MDESNKPRNNSLPSPGNGQSSTTEITGLAAGVSEYSILAVIARYLSENKDRFANDIVGSDVGSDDQLPETPIEEELPGLLPLTQSTQQQVDADPDAPTPETGNGNLDLVPELEGGLEFDIIYFDGAGNLVERDLVALNNSQHLQLDLIRWMKNAEQRKLGQQKLQPEYESTEAVLHQDFDPKDTVGSNKLHDTPMEEELPEQESPPTSSAQRVVEDATNSCTSYLEEEEDGNRIRVRRNLLEDYQLEHIQGLKRAEQGQYKREQQQLQSEGQSALAIYQDFVAKDTVGSDKLFETPTEEELHGQVSLPTSSAQEVDADTDTDAWDIENAVVELSEAELEICRCLDNELPGDEDEGYAYTEPGTENGVAELSERELEILRCLIDQEIRYVSVSKDQLEHHCQVCPKHSALLQTIEKVKQSLRKAQQLERR